MKKKHSKWEYEQFEDDLVFDGDNEEEIEVEEDNIDKIAKKLESKSSFTKHHSNKNKIKYHKKHLSKSKMTKKIINDSTNLNVNKNIKEKDYIESDISNSVISDISNHKTQKSYNIPNPISLEININSEMKKNLNGNNNISPNPKPNVLISQNINNIFDTLNDKTKNSFQLDNSKFLLNKLKGNKLLQEMKLKQNVKNKFSYYGKENNKSIDANENNNRAIVFNIIDNKNNMNEQLNKPNNKNKKIKKKRSYLNRRINNFYFRYVFNFNFRCYCKKCCRRNTRFNSINLIRNIFIFLVVFSAIGFYSIIFFYN
jgi:hypothetical protein